MGGVRSCWSIWDAIAASETRNLDKSAAPVLASVPHDLTARFRQGSAAG